MLPHIHLTLLHCFRLNSSIEPDILQYPCVERHKNEAFIFYMPSPRFWVIEVWLETFPWQLQIDFTLSQFFFSLFIWFGVFFWHSNNCHSLNRWFFLVYVAVLFIRTAKVKPHLSLARLAQESVTILKVEKYFLLVINKTFFSKLVSI